MWDPTRPWPGHPPRKRRWLVELTLSHEAGRVPHHPDEERPGYVIAVIGGKRGESTSD